MVIDSFEEIMAIICLTVIPIVTFEIGRLEGRKESYQKMKKRNLVYDKKIVKFNRTR